MAHREDAVPGDHRWGVTLAPLAVVALGPLAAAEDAVGAESLATVEITESAPGTDATGMRVAVFEAPAQVGSLGFWRVTEQMLDSALPKAREALVPGITIGDPFRVSVAGLEG